MARTLNEALKKRRRNHSAKQLFSEVLRKKHKSELEKWMKSLNSPRKKGKPTVIITFEESSDEDQAKLPPVVVASSSSSAAAGAGVRGPSTTSTSVTAAGVAHLPLAPASVSASTSENNTVESLSSVASASTRASIGVASKLTSGSDTDSNHLSQGYVRQTQFLCSHSNVKQSSSGTATRTSKRNQLRSRLATADILYQGNHGQTQCAAITYGDQRCRNCSVPSSSYCLMHEGYYEAEEINEETKSGDTSSGIEQLEQMSPVVSRGARAAGPGTVQKLVSLRTSGRSVSSDLLGSVSRTAGGRIDDSTAGHDVLGQGMARMRKDYDNSWCTRPVSGVGEMYSTQHNLVRFFPGEESAVRGGGRQHVETRARLSATLPERLEGQTGERVKEEETFGSGRVDIETPGVVRKCTAITSRRGICQRKVINGEKYCSYHTVRKKSKIKKLKAPPGQAAKKIYRCKGKTRSGRRCNCDARAGTDYCVFHTPQKTGNSPPAKACIASSVGSEVDEVGWEGHDGEGTFEYPNTDWRKAKSKRTLFEGKHDDDPICVIVDQSNRTTRADGNNNNDDNAYDDDDEQQVKIVERGDIVPYTHREFLRMWKRCEDYCGEFTDEIESTRRVRAANNKMSPEDSDNQLKAQYGRLLPRAMKKLMKEVLCLKPNDIFLDIGHGIGNTCIQAAFTAGCEARGIEVVYGRNSIAEVFRDHLQSQHKENLHQRKVGPVHLRHGRLEDVEHREFLTEGVTRAYVNNFNGVFAERSCKANQKWFLDDFVAGLFALMSPGSVLVTLHPLNLGPTREEANATRKKQGLVESGNASFYDVEKILLGKACDTVKWNQHSGNQKNIYVYKYTRLVQPADDAVILCCNKSCKVAKQQLPIPATTINESGRIVINHCECKITAKNLRRQRRKTYA